MDISYVHNLFFNCHMESQKEIIFIGILIENNFLYAYFIHLCFRLNQAQTDYNSIQRK
jgi:hypothetical protein